jgi:iron complex outermembrane receptor protein
MAMAIGSLITPGVAHAADAEEASAVEEITVTARKREENLLSTPIAITAITGDAIAKKGIVSLADLIDATPGVNVTSTNSGRNDRSFQQISLRGFTPSTTTSTLTASFIDGVPVASSTALNSVTDPARVEVLKGPQNAYFGRNAFAGAINVVNKTPADTFGGSFSASAYSRGGSDIQAALEGPLVNDVLSFRITGRSMEKGGSYINAANPSERLGDQLTRSGTGMLLFKPTAGLTIKAFGLYSEDKDGPSAQGIISAYELRSSPTAVGSFFGTPYYVNVPAITGNSSGTIIQPSQANCTINGNPFICGAAPSLAAGFSPAQNTQITPAITNSLANGASRVISPEDGVQGYGLKRRYMHAHFNVDYELSSALTLSSLTGFNDEQYSELADLDNYNGASLTNPLATATNGLLSSWTFPFLVERINRDFSQELRLSFDNKGPISGMIGASYLWTKSYSDLVSVFSEAVSGAARSVGSMSPPQQARTYGLFGSVNYEITPELSISAEGRWQRDKVYAFTGGRSVTISSVIASQYGLPAGTFAPLTNFYSKSYDNFMPRVIVNYKVTPDIMAYASWSKAANVSLGSFNTSFLSGSTGEVAAAQAINLQVVTQPEKLTNYEIGLKGKLFNNRVTFSLAAYAAEWTNQYNNRSSIFVDPTTNVAAIVSGVANSGRTLIKGFEADVTAALMDGFTLTASGAIADTNIRSFADPAITLLTGVTGNGFMGKSLPLTSKYSFSLSPQFSGKIPGDRDATWFIRGDVNYKSKQFADAANLTWINARTVVNGRVGVTLDNISLEVFATNLLNNKAYTAVAENNLLEPSFALSTKAYGYLNVGLPELRTIGVKASVKF